MLGFLSYEDRELFGLGPDVPPHLHLCSVTDRERAAFNPLPLKYLPIMNDGGGNLYCLDLTNGGDDPPIILHDHEVPNAPTLESGSFVEWLRRVTVRD
jgi:hypothetical protein